MALFIPIVLALATQWTSVTAQNSAPTVNLNPAVLQIPVGNVAEAAIQIDGVQDLYGFDVALKFDPNAVEVVAADAANPKAPLAAGKFLDAGFVAVNLADNAAGTTRFVMTQLNPSEPKSGSGILVVMKLRGLKEGAKAALTFTRADLARRDGKTFTATPVSGQVSVVAASQVVQAPSPFPTQNSAATLPTAAASRATALAATSAPAQPTAAPATAQSGDSSGTLLGAGVMGAVILLVAGIAVVSLIRRRRLAPQDGRH
ncbi:MAG TPA: cohesin domain-containing protein [Anaerolineae bacterium]